MKVKVLQWNVWFKENIELVLEFIENQDADIICLQELTRGYIEQTHENTWEYLAHKLGFDYRFQEIPISANGIQWSQANAIFSRFELKDGLRSWLHEPTDDRDSKDQYRGYLEVEVELGDTSLTVATTHMSFHPNPEADDELRNLLPILSERKQRYLLAADLNVTPDSSRVSEISRYLRNAGPDYDQPTWPTKPYSYPDLTASTPQRRFDYIFTSPDIRVDRAYLTDTDVSDHLPVTVELEIN